MQAESYSVLPKRKPHMVSLHIPHSAPNFGDVGLLAGIVPGLSF